MTAAPNPDYPPERGMPGAVARLEQTEDWSTISAAANSSPNHVSSDERWTRKAREANPALTDEQAHRLGQHMKKAFYVGIGKKSGQTRKLAKEAAAIEGEDYAIPAPDTGTEMQVMIFIAEALDGLDARARRRIVRYFHDREFGDATPPAKRR